MQYIRVLHLLRIYRIDAGCQLVTLVGPGGVGKTRLAMEAARQYSDSQQFAPDFSDGVFSVELTGCWHWQRRWASRLHLSCYRVLAALGDERDQIVLSLAVQQLQERAARLHADEMRQSFLEQVPIHRALLLLGRERAKLQRR